MMFLIIGYGSLLRGDDGVGQHIAHYLQAMLESDQVQVIACHQLTPELVEPISRAQQVIFVDVAEEGQPGDIHCWNIQPEVAAEAFTHNVSPASLLAAARDLYGVCPYGTVISIGGTQFDYGETLSSPVAKAVPKVVNQICQLIEIDGIDHTTKDYRTIEGTK